MSDAKVEEQKENHFLMMINPSNPKGTVVGKEETQYDSSTTYKNPLNRQKAGFICEKEGKEKPQPCII